MERIDVSGESAPPFSFRPDWAEVIDNRQVGCNARTARWEIYDAGCEAGDTGPAWDAINSLYAFE
jgi:hypothetical protein